MRLTASPVPSPRASTNFLVPLCAILPRLFTSSDLVMPTPVSSIVTVPASPSGLIRMDGPAARSAGASPPAGEEALMERKRFLSHASAAFDTSSRKKTSLFEYSELMMMSMTRPTSAWNLGMDDDDGGNV